MNFHTATRAIRRDREQLDRRAQLALSALSARLARRLDSIEAEIAAEALARARSANQLARESIAALS